MMTNNNCSAGLDPALCLLCELLYLIFPNDKIKDVPVSVIQRLAINNQTMAGVVKDLKGYIGTYFTQKEFDDFMVVYREGLGL